MSGYIGSTPVPQATQHRESFTCTEGQTTFGTAGYTPSFLDVYLNGSHLSPADFVATNGSAVVLVVAASADDVCDIISYSAFELNSQTFTGVVSFADGSASAPSITNTGDTNTGLLFPAADTIAITTAGAEALRIDAAGAITTPKQPAFLARPASTQSNIPINAVTTVVLGTEVFDQNADFASNTFTAPVTGKYQFTAALYCSQLDVDTAYYQLELRTSNRVYYDIISMDGHDADLGNHIFKLTVLADMDASDTAFLVFNLPNSGAAQMDIGGPNNGQFSGYLAC